MARTRFHRMCCVGASSFRCLGGMTCIFRSPVYTNQNKRRQRRP